MECSGGVPGDDSTGGYMRGGSGQDGGHVRGDNYEVMVT